ARDHPYPGAVQAHPRRARPAHLLADHAGRLSRRAAQGRRAPATRRHGAPRKIRHVEIHEQRAGHPLSLFAAREDRAGLQPFLCGPSAGAGRRQIVMRCDLFVGWAERSETHRRTRDRPTRPVGYAPAALTHPTRLARVVTVGIFLALSANVAHALDQVRVGKAVPNSFAFGATEVGIEAKTFAQEGLEVVATGFRGDAQLQQTLAAGSVDIGLGSGPGLGFRAKGAPAIGVAGLYGPPGNIALSVPANSPSQ